MSDEEIDLLAERLAAGDAEALPAYLDLQRPKLLAFIEHRLGASLRRKIDPDDIWQETSIEALRSFEQMDLTQRDPFSWLCQTAERRIIDAHRKFFASQKRAADREVSLNAPAGGGGGGERQSDLVNLLVASMTTASQKFARGHRERALLAALEELPEIQRQALQMRYLEGLPSKEVATRLGKTDGAIRVMLTRSITKLQSILGAEPEV